MVLKNWLRPAPPGPRLVASPVNYGAGAGGGRVVAEPEQGVHADGFPLLDPLRNDTDHGADGQISSCGMSCLRFRLWDGSDVPQPEGRGDRDAGGGWRRQFAVQVMQTGGSGLVQRVGAVVVGAGAV